MRVLAFVLALLLPMAAADGEDKLYRDAQSVGSGGGTFVGAVTFEAATSFEAAVCVEADDVDFSIGAACTDDGRMRFDGTDWLFFSSGSVVINADLEAGTRHYGTNPGQMACQEDVEITSASADGTLHSYGSCCDGVHALQTMCESDGAGGVDVIGVRFGGFNGAKSECKSVTTILDFDTGAATETATGLLPQGAFDFWVTGAVIEADTGACTSVDVGDGSTQDLYVDDLDETTIGASFGSADHQATLVRNVTAASDVVATAVGGNCADLRIRLVVGYCISTGPTN